MLREIARAPGHSPRGSTLDSPDARKHAPLVLEPGAVIAGRFRLERPLGEGGMGIVWEAAHLVTRKPVALKFVKRGRDEAVTRQRFLREARAACAVRHASVVQVHDVLELEGGLPVMVMDLLHGETLAARLEREKKLSLEETARTLLPVCSALGCAHNLGIVHRDLKPENVFLATEPDGSSSVKVLDFGIAKLTAVEGEAARTSETMTGGILGTPYYMAPEQIFGEKDIDHRADIWALGVIVYECLAGVRPTRADNVGQVLKLVMSDRIEPIETVAPELPPPVASLIGRMLSRDRDARPANMHVVIDVLAQHSTVRVRSFGPPSTAMSQPSDRPAFARDSTIEARGDARRSTGSALVAALPGESTAHRRRAWQRGALIALPAALALVVGGFGLRGRGASRPGAGPAASPGVASLAAPLPPTCAGAACNEIVDLAAGGDFACAVLRSGDPWCWGGDAFGQLGTREGSVDCSIAGAQVACRPTPAVVPGLHGVTSVAANHIFACALTASGEVLCWGANNHAQLGHATGAEGDESCGDADGVPMVCNATPRRVQGIPSMKQISAGSGFACGLSTGGEVFCWGRSNLGQTGRGVAAPALLPGRVVGGPMVGQPDAGALPAMAYLSAGNTHACAIDVQQRLWCWGDNMYGGPLGHPTGTNDDQTITAGVAGRIYNPWPQRANKDASGNVAPLDDVTTLATPGSATCVVSNDGPSRLLCWGWALGATTGVPGWGRNSTWRPHDVNVPVGISALAGRGLHVCGLGTDGTVLCAGNNDRGELGRGVVGGGQDDKACYCGACCYYTPKPVPGLHAARIAGSSGLYELALMTDGTVLGWGANGAGQTGHAPGSHGDRDCTGGIDLRPELCNPDPVKVEGLP
jgi:serine/threonine-protein kinase